MKINIIRIAYMATILAYLSMPAVQAQEYEVVTCVNENNNVPASTPTAQFTLHSNGTATDTATGLMWMRCSLGQTWNGSTCTGSAATYNWQQALQVVQGVNSGTSNADNDNAVGFAGYIDWRLPNKNELESIVEHRCWAPAINATIFPNMPTNIWYWSSSPLAYYSISVWGVTFYDGYVSWLSKSDSNVRVRLVRAEQ